MCWLTMFVLKIRTVYVIIIMDFYVNTVYKIKKEGKR